jgi:hypothetical protein
MKGMRNMAICRICKTPANEEHPNVVYGKNPYTFRKAIMHYDCFCEALLDIQQQPPKSQTYVKVSKYKNRLEEYQATE